MDAPPPTSGEQFRVLTHRSLTWLASALLASALAAAALTAAVAPPRADATTLAGDCTPGADWGTLRSDLASQTVELVNAHRTALGLKALVVSSALEASAVWKARHMAKYGYMSHSDPAPPVARSAGERMQACGVTGSWGENIAYGYTTAQSVFNAWLNSSGHRANIENPNWLAIGSGAASAGNSVFWAHSFGSSTGGAAPAPAPQPPAPKPPAPAPGPAPSEPAPEPARSPQSPSSQSPSSPAPGDAPSSDAAATEPRTASSTGVVLRGLRLDPSRPRAGRTMRSSVAVFKHGSRLRAAHVFCSARLEGRALRVVARRFRRGRAACAWKVPASARGKLVSAAIVVQQGRVEVNAPFRARVAS